MLDLLVAVVLGAVAIVVAFLFLHHSFKKSAASTRTVGCGGSPPELIPGWSAPPSDPLLGDLGVASASGSLQRYLQQQHSGGTRPVVAFWWRDRRVVSVCSPRAFKDTEVLYENKSKHMFAQCFEPLHGSGSVQIVCGAEWEKRRLTRGAVRGRNLELFFSDFVEIAKETESMWTHATTVLLRKEMFRMTCKAILTTSLGNIFDDNSGIESLIDAYDLCKCEMDERILDEPPPSGCDREVVFQENLSRLKEWMRQMIKTRRGQKEGKKLPILDTLLSSGAPEDQVVSDMLTYLGGFHTAAFYMMWTFYYLARNTGVQEKLLQEIYERVDGDYSEKLKAYTLTSKSYLRQVLDEANRMSTTAAFAGYEPDQDIVVHGYCIPAKTPIMQALGVAMENETVWKASKCFNPDRFAPGTKAAKRGHEFRPFGVSLARRCPANQFSLLMASVYTTILLRRYMFKTVNDKQPEQEGGIATKPKDDISIRVHVRQQY